MVNTSPQRAEHDHILHPNVRQSIPTFVAGEGIELIDNSGRRYLDAASGVGVTCLGYSADEVADALFTQAKQLQYVHSLRFQTPIVQRLAAMIADIAPEGLDYVLFASGGSEANESGVKLVRQYWLERGQPDRWKFIGRRPSFHGNTLATLSLGWHAGRRKRHAPLLLDLPHIETPNQYRGCTHCRDQGGCTLACADELEQVILREGPESIAAFIAEPVVGAAGGALVAPPGYFPRVREICDRYDVLLVADEVITGFGRIGRWFGIERFDVRPDLIVFAKGVSGGYAPLAGVIAHESLVDAFRRGSGRFEHNFTMSGHPVACAAGVAVVTMLHEQRLIERVAALEQPFFAVLRACLEDVSIVGDIRGLGLLGGIELVADRETKRPFAPELGVSARAAHYALEEGVIPYPCGGGIDGGDEGDYLLLMPPFVSSEEQLAEMADRLARALRRLAVDLQE